MGQGESVPMSENGAAATTLESRVPSTSPPNRFSPGETNETMQRSIPPQYQQQIHKQVSYGNPNYPKYGHGENGAPSSNGVHSNVYDPAAIAVWHQQQVQYIMSLPLPHEQKMHYYQQCQLYIQQHQLNHQQQQQFAAPHKNFTNVHESAQPSSKYPTHAQFPHNHQAPYYQPSRAPEGLHNTTEMISNLSLQRQPSSSRPKQNVESDWNKAWEDDGDDSSAEEETNKPSSQHIHSFCPTLDEAHSSATDPKCAKAKNGADNTLSKQADLVLQTGDGVVWDTGATKIDGMNGEKEAYEKPCIEMFFPLLRVLGKGSFGKVVLVRKRTGKESGGLFAMKILRKAHLVKRRQIERTKTERKVLSVVDHPFIMKLHFAFQTDEKLYLVLDYCPGGELFFHLSRYRRFPERVARFYAAELLLAIGHLHRRGIIYRDLKPENVLLDAEGHVKLGDFGLAKDRIIDPCSGATSMCGTPEYMAPEILSQAGHGLCVDYWGLGMLIYEMMTGLPPWYTTDRQKLFKRLKAAPLEIPSYFTTNSASVVSTLLDRNPRTRLGVNGNRSVMEHSFFKSIPWKGLLSKRMEAPIRPYEGWSVQSENKNEPSNDSHTTNKKINDSRSTKNIIHLDTISLDAATANFDKAFTRMPVETEDIPGEDNPDSESCEGSEELNEKTFTGFTFDDALEAKKNRKQLTNTHRKHHRGIPIPLSSSPQSQQIPR